ncbi:hypothetical protein [Ruminococcus bovis]|uniref:Bacterial repeat domain-containing protein n=3 Tax=Ruminococcus TaxID=1263 RepID=A0A4P8XUQ0_9FIRM|nr:hypothetical protein [Ruminococcus bovis]QCT06795.1 hypothetical protein E5Z56_05195 [Ruminococcus bovis]
MKLKKVLSLALCGVMLSTTAVSIIPTISAEESSLESYATSNDTYGSKIENGGFEKPVITVGWGAQKPQSEVPYWSTTATDNKIEMFKENTAMIKGVKVTPPEGSQAAELNAEQTGTLYQYVKTSGGSQYKWNLYHRGRTGDDTMALVIGPKQKYNPKKTSANSKDQFMKIVDWAKNNIAEPRNSNAEIKTNDIPTKLTVYSKPFDNNGDFENSTDNNFSFEQSYIYSERWDVWIMKSDNKEWHHYGDETDLPEGESQYNIYNVPEESNESIFGFVAYATSNGNLTCGNFLDGIEFELYHPAKTQSNTGGSGSVEYTFDGTTTKTDFRAEQSVDTMVDDESTVKVTAIPDFAKDSSGTYKKDKDGNYIQNNFLGAYVTYNGESHYIDKDDSRWTKVTKHNDELNQDYDTYEYTVSGVSGRVIVDLYYSEIYTVTFLENGGKKYDATTRGTREGVEVSEDSNNVVRFNSVTSGKYVSETCQWWNPEDTNGRFYGWELLDYKDANGNPVIFDRDTTITYTYSGGSTDGLCFTIKDTKGHEVTTMKAVDGITFLARWQPHVKIVPQIENSDGTYTDSNVGGTVSIEKTDEVYDYSENTDGSFEYYSYMNRDFNVTATAKSGYVFLGWYDENDKLITLSENHKTQVTNIGKTEFARFKYNSYNVRFHINDEDTVSTASDTSADVISDRIYSPSYVEGDRNLNSDNTISYFYDIPKTTKNGQQTYKVFKGWYLNKDNDDDSKPIVWDKTKFDIDTDVYAHWIDRGTVAKDSSDTKQTGSSSYIGFDLFGVQLRSAEKDPNYPDGTGSTPAYATQGLRFVTSLSEDLLNQINSLDSKTKPSYGYVLAKTSTANTYAKGSSDYELQYNGKNVNGVDTTTTYKYIKNVDCTSKKTNSASAITLDHFNASKYRIYSLVVTYDNLSPELIANAIKQPVVARSYIRYTDANGLLRTYYNDYSGTSTYKGCSTSYSKVKDFIQDNYQNIDK